MRDPAVRRDGSPDAQQEYDFNYYRLQAALSDLQRAMTERLGLVAMLRRCEPEIWKPNNCRILGFPDEAKGKP